MHYWQRYLCFTMTCVTTYLCLDTFLLLIFLNITLFIYGLFYGSSVHHGYSKPWCLSKHLGFLPYLWIWCCHGCGVWKKTHGVTCVTPYLQPFPFYWSTFPHTDGIQLSAFCLHLHAPLILFILFFHVTEWEVDCNIIFWSGTIILILFLTEPFFIKRSYLILWSYPFLIIVLA